MKCCFCSQGKICRIYLQFLIIETLDGMQPHLCYFLVNNHFNKNYRITVIIFVYRKKSPNWRLLLTLPLISPKLHATSHICPEIQVQSLLGQLTGMHFWGNLQHVGNIVQWSILLMSGGMDLVIHLMQSARHGLPCFSIYY